MTDTPTPENAIDPADQVPVPGILETSRNSQLRRILSATLLWGSGHQLITVSQGYLLFELTDSTLWLAGLGAAVGIPNVLVAILGGLLADRVSRKRLLMIGAAIAGLPMLSIMVLLMLDALQPWHLLVAGAAQGAALALDWIARLSLLPDVVPRKILVRAVAFDQTAFSLARVLGPLVGGFVLASLGSAAAYGLMVGLFGLAIVAYTLIQPHTEVVKKAHSGIVEEFKEVGKVLRGNVIIRLNLMFTAVNALMLGGFIFIIPAFSKDVFNSDEIGLGYLYAAVGIGALGGAITMSLAGGIRRAGLALSITNILFGGSVAVWVYTDTLALALPIALLIGYFNAVHISLGLAVIQVNVPPEVRGRVIGAYELAWSGFPLGGLASGSLAAIFGLSASLTILAMGVLAFTFVVMIASAQFRQLSTEGR